MTNTPQLTIVPDLLGLLPPDARNLLGPQPVLVGPLAVSTGLDQGDGDLAVAALEGEVQGRVSSAVLEVEPRRVRLGGRGRRQEQAQEGERAGGGGAVPVEPEAIPVSGPSWSRSV